MADGEAGTTEPLGGKIVVIPRADPGYDWLFAHGIGALLPNMGGPTRIWPSAPPNSACRLRSGSGNLRSSVFPRRE